MACSKAALPVGDCRAVRESTFIMVESILSSYPDRDAFLDAESLSMTLSLPTYDNVVAALPLVRRHLRPTPLLEWPALSRLLGCRYLIKHENHNPTTAFKVRGGIHLVSRLPDAQKRRGVIACTTGNHGQSLAYACRLFGVPCTLVVPESANPDKVAAMQALGAQLVAHGADFDAAREHCELIC